MSTEQYIPTEYAKQKYANAIHDLQLVRDYCIALLVIAGADGEVTPMEMKWMINEGRLIGVPEEILAEIPTMQWRGVNLEEILERVAARHSLNTRRALLYQSIKMSRADGIYHAAEREAVLRAARTLKIDLPVVDAIHALADMEDSVDRMRHALLERKPDA